MQYLQKKLNYFGVPSVEKQYALLKKRSSPVPPIVGESQAPSAESAVSDATNDDDNWDLERAVRLDDVEQASTKRH